MLSSGHDTQHSVSLQKPNRATAAQLGLFHTQDYIEFLERAKPETVTEQEVEHYNVIEDSPIFDGVFQFCQIYAGASIHGAQKLVQDDYDIAINWAGGLHHAKKSQAEGEITFSHSTAFYPQHCHGGSRHAHSALCSWLLLWLTEHSLHCALALMLTCRQPQPHGKGPPTM